MHLGAPGCLPTWNCSAVPVRCCTAPRLPPRPRAVAALSCAQVYRIPPRVGASGWRSGEWRVNDKVRACLAAWCPLHGAAMPVGLLPPAPPFPPTCCNPGPPALRLYHCAQIFTGRCRVVAQGQALEVRLEDPQTCAAYPQGWAACCAAAQLHNLAFRGHSWLAPPPLLGRPRRLHASGIPALLGACRCVALALPGLVPSLCAALLVRSSAEPSPSPLHPPSPAQRRAVWRGAGAAWAGAHCSGAGLRLLPQLCAAAGGGRPRACLAGRLPCWVPAAAGGPGSMRPARMFFLPAGKAATCAQLVCKLVHCPASLLLPRHVAWRRTRHPSGTPLWASPLRSAPPPLTSTCEWAPVLFSLLRLAWDSLPAGRCPAACRCLAWHAGLPWGVAPPHVMLATCARRLPGCCRAIQDHERQQRRAEEMRKIR